MSSSVELTSGFMTSCLMLLLVSKASLKPAFIADDSWEGHVIWEKAKEVQLLVLGLWLLRLHPTL